MGAKLSSDGKRVLTLDRKDGLTLVDLRGGRTYLLERDKEYTGEIFAIDLSANGLYAIAAGVDRIAWIWDLENLDKITRRELKGHTKAIDSVYITPNADMAITGSRDKKAAIWRLTSPDLVPQFLEGHQDDVTAVYLTADGVLAATGSADATATVWNCETLEKIATITELSRVIYFVFISSDKTNAIAASRDHTVQQLELVPQNEISVSAASSSFPVAAAAIPL